jgi:hypothetical protein
MYLILKHIQNWIEIVSRIVSRIFKKLRHCNRLYPEFSRIDSSKTQCRILGNDGSEEDGHEESADDANSLVNATSPVRHRASVCAAPDAGVRPHRYFSAPKQ